MPRLQIVEGDHQDAHSVSCGRRPTRPSRSNRRPSQSRGRSHAGGIDWWAQGHGVNHPNGDLPAANGQGHVGPAFRV